MKLKAFERLESVETLHAKPSEVTSRSEDEYDNCRGCNWSPHHFLQVHRALELWPLTNESALPTWSPDIRSHQPRTVTGEAPDTSSLSGQTENDHALVGSSHGGVDVVHARQVFRLNQLGYYRRYCLEGYAAAMVSQIYRLWNKTNRCMAYTSSPVSLPRVQ